MIFTIHRKLFSGLILCASMLQACALFNSKPAAEEPKPDPGPQVYTPNFEYKVSPAAEKLGVTLGIIEPQFIEGGDLYWRANLEDEIVNEMLLSVKTTFKSIVSAKGFNTRGPFSNLNSMTYPDKQGSDLLLYPEFAYQVQIKMENQREVPVEDESKDKSKGFNLLNLGSSDKKDETAAPQKTETVCDVVLKVSGKVIFVAQEPLTGEKMWNKDIDLKAPPQSFGSEKGASCAGKRSEWSQEVKNAWAKAHESIFQASMKALDDYLNGEEFQALNENAKELREMKRF
jgi:hypothetical protein